MEPDRFCSTPETLLSRTDIPVPVPVPVPECHNLARFVGLLGEPPDYFRPITRLTSGSVRSRGKVAWRDKPLCSILILYAMQRTLPVTGVHRFRYMLM